MLTRDTDLSVYEVGAAAAEAAERCEGRRGPLRQRGLVVGEQELRQVKVLVVLAHGAARRPGAGDGEPPVELSGEKEGGEL